MQKTLFIVAVLIIGGGGLYYYYGNAILPDPFQQGINSRVDEALSSAVIDVTEFGGGTATFTKGETKFSTGSDGEYGTARLGEPRAVVVKGEDADVLALVNVNGGGSGTFQYLVRFEFIGAEQKVHEIEKVLLGDRIIIDSIATEITSPTSYDVMVTVKDRKEGEPMSVTPSVQKVLNFTGKDGALELTAVIFGTLDQHDVVLVSPLPESTIENSFIVKGAARGPWYFEASLPIMLKSPDGTILAQSPAQAQGEWMTTELVPFTASLVAPSTYHGPATLVIKNDNPSGDPERDKMVEIPVTVK